MVIDDKVDVYIGNVFVVIELIVSWCLQGVVLLWLSDLFFEWLYFGIFNSK